MAAVDRYIAKTRRRVSFEYALMRGINDSEQTALDLADLLRGRLCHVNIILLTPSSSLPYERPDPAGIEHFAGILRAGIPTSIRYSRDWTSTLPAANCAPENSPLLRRPIRFREWRRVSTRPGCHRVRRA